MPTVFGSPGAEPLEVSLGTLDTTNMEITFGSKPDFKLGSAGKIVAGVVLAIVVVVLLLEWTVLRGEQVARLTVNSTNVEKLILDRIGEKHMFEVATRERRNGETTGRAVKIKLVDPNGKAVYESSSFFTKKERFFSFIPEVAGTYQLSIRPERKLGGSSFSTAHVGVFVGDRRILARLTAAMPF